MDYLTNSTVEDVADPWLMYINSLPDDVENIVNFRRADNGTSGKPFQDSIPVIEKPLPVPKVDRSKIHRDTINLLQEWEGYVTSIESETFTARLNDLTNRESSEEEVVELSLDDLSDFDRAKLQVGAIFRWLVGYAVSPSGSKRRFSSLVLRRLPAWTAQSIQRRNEETRKLVRSIEWD